MKKLNKLLSELGISKVNLAKILGVSRQMVYNYLKLESLNKWPIEKRIILFDLLDVENIEAIKNLKISTSYAEEVEIRLMSMIKNKNKVITKNNNFSNVIDTEQQEILNDIIELMTEKFKSKPDIITYNTFLYLYHFLKTMEVSPELKYFLAYISKAAGFTKPDDFAFNEAEQFTFESIMFSAMTLYNNSGGTSKSKLAESRRRFVQQIEQKMEEKLSRTLELNSIKIQALKELGYEDITTENGSEVFEKMAEIEARKVNM